MDMLTCNLKKNSKIPLYEQLYEFIRIEIMQGRILYGKKLPSKRKLAGFLEISQNTVELAYDQLIAEGYIESKPRRGYFVLAYEDLEYIEPEREETAALEAATTFDYNFHPGRIDTEHFPFHQWRKYARRVMNIENQQLLLMGNWQGEKVLRKEIATYLYQARGVRCSPEDIILGAGVEILLQQLILLLGNEKAYGVEDPGYHAISRILENYPNHVEALDVDGQGAVVDGLDKRPLDIIYVTPSRHFPYGSVLSANRRIKLLNWAADEESRYIIEDDYDSEFRYVGKAIPSLQSMDQNGKVIYLGTFSKSLIPSIRISYMVLPKQLMKQYKEKLHFFQCSVSRIDQHILAEFMREGDFSKHLNRMRNIYRRKMEKTLAILEEYKERIEVVGDLSGFHLVIKMKNKLTESELVKRAAQANIKIYPLSSYVLNHYHSEEPVIILGFAGVPERDLETGIEQLITSWKIK